MIKTYIINTRQLEAEAVFHKMLESVSPYRRQKIALLKNDNDKRRSLGAAIALNKALGSFGLEERAMEYELGSHGKPFLRYYPEIHFSLSHSKDYAMCSIGNVDVGNDIEWVRGGKEKVAKRFFAAEEFAWIKNASDSKERDERMFQIWTMKESFLKVTGLGMSLLLKDFAVIMDENGNIALSQSVDDKKYYIKEYAMPPVFNEQGAYKIAVCSPDSDFAPNPEQIVLTF
ncbi:MAG: 4'-phosphopantetheinyl transferase superfamily protein [Lachnospiraceae bacterium]|nr:4'-phosphopantetheinyl transferase superfamily protein [Lachnospiraceae bacterium]